MENEKSIVASVASREGTDSNPMKNLKQELFQQQNLSTTVTELVEVIYRILVTNNEGEEEEGVPTQVESNIFCSLSNINGVTTKNLSCSLDKLQAIYNAVKD